jgi:hypothetical protein|tara:strand:+ start:5735 stop:6076 length:342 start_codon:yes stop_codon:yes gene_type:complete
MRRMTSTGQSEVKPWRLVTEIWREIFLGVGMWGAFRPIFAALLAAIPGLFLGQHFNRKHRRAFDWTLLQIPLALTIVLYIPLWLWSIYDAWRDATVIVSNAQQSKESTVGPKL